MGRKKIALPRDEVIAAYERGEHRAVIAARYGVSTRVIDDRLLEWHVPLRPRKSLRGRKGGVLTDLPKDEVMAAYAGGESLLSLGTRFDCDPVTVKRRLISWGVVLVGGVDVSGLAEDLGVSVEVLRELLSKRGFPTS